VSYIVIVEDSIMRKVMVIGCFIAGFLLMMIPNVNSIEYQNQKNIITSEIEIMDYSSFVKMVKQIPKDELRALLKDTVQNLSDEPAICNLLFLIFILFSFTIFRVLLFAFLIYVYAYLIGCEWAIIIKPSLTTNTCNCN
jgi:hypothetical protein